MNKTEKLKSLIDRRSYKRFTTIDQDPYSEEFWPKHHTWGTVITRKWKKKEIYRFEYRLYRTWKYNRLMQWK